MYGKLKKHLQLELQDIKNNGLYKEERIITSPQGAEITLNTGEKVLNFCANNYLGLSSHPEVVQAAKDAMDTHGFGMSSVRFICGTQDIHKKLESKIAEFYQTEDTILYAAAFDANGGVFEPILSKEDAIKHNLNCERANMYKNYYTYLYGLPMKLKDLGARLSNSVERKVFQGKTYLVLRISYDESVGSDNWYVYINPETYAMEIYQFFKTDVNGNEIETSGEYILLSDETVINGIKMPKNRAWFYNKDDLYLGTDILK